MRRFIIAVGSCRGQPRPDEVYQALQAQFTPEEQVALTLLIATINGWNRVQIGFRAVHPVAKREAA